MGISSPKRHGAHGAAQKQGTGIAHEHFGGLKFHSKKPMHPAAMATEKMPMPYIFVKLAMSMKKTPTKKVTEAFSPSIAVGEVDGVDNAHNHHRAQRPIEPAKVHRSHKGDHGGGVAARRRQHAQVRPGHNELQNQLLQRGQPPGCAF